MRRKTQEIWKRTGKPERDLKRGTKKAQFQRNEEIEIRKKDHKKRIKNN